MNDRLLDPRQTDALDFYDAEVQRLRTHLLGLDEAAWGAPSHCPGWSVKDVLSHLAEGESYNQMCLDDRLGEINSLGGGIDAWNARAVRQRRETPPGEVLDEWSERQTDVRERWGKLGMEARIPTSVGPYPLRLQVWHLAEELAHHADDIEVAVPADEQGARLWWRASFLVFAAAEERRPLPARLQAGAILLDRAGGPEKLDLETFVAYATDRPWLVADPARRQLVTRLQNSH